MLMNWVERCQWDICSQGLEALYIFSSHLFLDTETLPKNIKFIQSAFVIASLQFSTFQGCFFVFLLSGLCPHKLCTLACLSLFNDNNIMNPFLWECAVFHIHFSFPDLSPWCWPWHVTAVCMLRSDRDANWQTARRDHPGEHIQSISLCYCLSGEFFVFLCIQKCGVLSLYSCLWGIKIISHKIPILFHIYIIFVILDADIQGYCAIADLWLEIETSFYSLVKIIRALLCQMLHSTGEWMNQWYRVNINKNEDDFKNVTSVVIMHT